MESIDKIPVSKIKRASKLLETGVKVGVNYVKYHARRIADSEESARAQLDASNASDMYDGLKQLKGSALKVAQMLSMEKNIMPEAYVEKFSLAQFSVPPLSPALVTKTFRKYFQKSPHEVFDAFDSKSSNAASIGQVHRAEKNNKALAVKIQYPGVADSISSDLALVKPIAMRMFNIPSKGSEQYFAEVEQKLISETDYRLELAQSQELAKECAHLPNLRFPKYYPKLSSDRVLTMDWMDGLHLSEYCKSEATAEQRQLIGQSLWDFYMYQIHALRKVHADPHPGNFLVSDKDELIVLDFGCVKEIPENFYEAYMGLADDAVLQDDAAATALLYQLDILREGDSSQEKAFFKNMFMQLVELITRPLRSESFDFSDSSYFTTVATVGEGFYRDSNFKKLNSNRGSKHFIYFNRALVGLYHLMHSLQATAVIKKADWARAS